MSGTALVLVLVAAVCHALWNLAARGVEGDGRLFVFWYAVGSVVLMVPVVAVWAAVTDPEPPSLSWLWAGVVSGLLHSTYMLVLQRGYAGGDLSVVYPVARGVGPLLTLVVAVAALGERPGPVETVGAVVVVAGVAVLSLPDRVPRDGARSVRAGVLWGAATGVTIAAYTLWDAHSVGTLAIPPVPYFAVSVLCTLLPLAPLAWRQRDRLGGVLRTDWRPVLVVAVLSPLAYVLVLEAMKRAPVALVAATRESSIVLGTLLGVVLLAEPGGWRRTIGSLVVLCGIGLVALG